MSRDSDDLPKIRIYEVQGGSDRDSNNLMGCYFQQVNTPGHFGLFEPGDDHRIPTVPEEIDGDQFQFVRGGTLWTVTEFIVDELTNKARAHWSNGRGVEDDDGTFQAQAGPTFEEASSSATA